MENLRVERFVSDLVLGMPPSPPKVETVSARQTYLNKRKEIAMSSYVSSGGILSWGGLHFSLSEPEDSKAVVYQIVPEADASQHMWMYRVEHLDFTEKELDDGGREKTFFIDIASPEIHMVILHFFLQKMK